MQGEHKSLVLLKKSKFEEIDIRTEAFVHWLSHKKMAEIGFGIRVPPVYDIVTCIDDEVAFTIGEYTGSQLCSRFLADSKQFQKDFLHCIGQLAILVQILEDRMSLDHRDLKADNLLVRPEPSVLNYTLNGKHRTLKSPFTLCIVDFGYACLGDANGITEVDAGEGVFPPLDPCPKDGRDLFHFIVSIYGLDALRSKLTPTLVEVFQNWMNVKGKSVEPMVKRWSYTEWLFLRTSEQDFGHPQCTPRAILELVEKLDPSLVTGGGGP